MGVDLLAFGPHPDDIEIGLGGIVALHAALGFTVGLCDLTQGEMGSNGTIDERRKEAAAAANVLGSTWRENLEWPDRRIGKDPAHLEQAVAFIRRHRPRVIAAPYWSDRHPDHVAASAVLSEAAFNSGLRRYPAEGDPWRPEWICYYFLNESAPPSFVVDVSQTWKTKMRSVHAYQSQFHDPNSKEPQTFISDPKFLEMIDARGRHFGALIGVHYGEAFVTKQPPRVDDLIGAYAGREV